MCGVISMVKDVHKHDYVDSPVVERDRDSIEWEHRNMSVVSDRYVYPAHRDVRPVALHQRSDQAITTPDVQDCGIWWRHLSEVTPKHTHSSLVHDVAMQPVEYRFGRPRDQVSLMPRMLTKKLDRIVCHPSAMSVDPGMTSLRVSL